MKRVNQEIKEVVETYTNEKEMFISYLDEFDGVPLPSEYICVYGKDFKEEFEYYNLVFGNVATITKRDEENLSVNLNSNYYSKEVMRELTKKYELLSFFDHYDQLFAPHWEFYFKVKNEDIEVFLNEVLELKETYREEKSDIKMVYSVAETMEGVRVQLTEQKDWEAFREEMTEHYHSSIIHRLKDKGLKGIRNNGDSSFYCDMPKEEVLHMLENEENMVFDKSFDEYIKKDSI